MTKPVLFISGPYRAPSPDGILTNIMAARDVARSVWQAGAVALCPHTNTALMDGCLPDSVWLEGDIELLRRCDGVVLLPGWAASEGTLAEREVALQMRMPIFEWPVHKDQVEAFAASFDDTDDSQIGEED
jgi:hypothetical protein